MRRLIAIALLASPAFAAVDLRLDGDRIWMNADNATLREVMQAFAHAGVSVRYDEGITATCSGVLTNAAADKALVDLFGPFGYVITWDVIRGPIGEMTRLSEIQLFRQGNKDAAKPLVDDGKLPVTRLPGHAPFVSDEILIGFKPGTKMDQVRQILAQIGGTIVGSVPKIGVYRIRLPPGANVLSLVDMLKQNGVTAAVEPNYVTSVPRDPNTGGGKSKINSLSPAAGGAAKVAVLDSGQLSGSGYDAGVAGRFNALQPGAPMSDSVGHGTQMSMIASGAVTPGGANADANAAAVPVLAVKAFDDSGMTSNYALMEAINYASSQGAKVVNLSWGSDTSSDFVMSSIISAQNDGMIVVAAAGNEATGKPVYPSAYPGVVSVAALNADGSVWENSNYGSSVTVAAPGTADFPVGHEGPPGTYAGTSIASAYVSHALAQYMTQNPTATSQQAVNALTASVTDAGVPGKDPVYGYGKLDAAAMQRLLGK